MDVEMKCQSTSRKRVCTQEIPSSGKCLHSDQHEYTVVETEESVAKIQVAHRRIQFAASQ